MMAAKVELSFVVLHSGGVEGVGDRDVEFDVVSASRSERHTEIMKGKSTNLGFARQYEASSSF